MKIRNNIIKYSEPLILAGLWLAVFAAPFIMFHNDGELEWGKLISSWGSVLPFFIIFLFNHFVLVPFLLFRNKRLMYIIAAVIVAVLFSFSLHYFENDKPIRPQDQEKMVEMQPPHIKPDAGMPPPMMHPPDRKPNPFPYPHFINSIILAILILGFDTGVKMIVRSSKLEHERNILEKENVQNQLAFLRNQVSPHFFMNTLNNIHVLIDINTEEAKEAVIKLSKLMRHLLYDSDSELVQLSKEIEFIVSYINLMKLRFSEKVDISLNIPDEIPHKKIPPLLFTSFVENAFKHGISYQEHSFITINFEFEESKLFFEIKNRKQQMAMDDKDSGIGLDNSVKRLDLLYGKAYSLTVDEEDEIYKLKLSIPL
jgi:hypothetical protein